MDPMCMMNSKEAGAWLGQCSRRIIEKSKGKNPKIPGAWLNDRTVVFNPLTVLVKLASDSGLKPELIQVMVAGIMAGAQVNVNQSQKTITLNLP